MARPKGSKNRPKGDAAPKTKKSGGKKGAREKFAAPVNTKTGAKGDEVQGKAGKPANGEAPVTAKDVQRVASGKYLKELLSELRGLKGDSAEINGAIREKISYGVQHKFIHKGALADYRRLEALGEKKGSSSLERLAAHWHTLIRYMELTGLMAKIEAVGRLPLGDDDKPGPGDGAEGADTGETGEDAEASGGGAGDQQIQPAGGEVSEQPNAEAEAGESENVTRPMFGQRPVPMSQSERAEARREAAGLKH